MMTRIHIELSLIAFPITMAFTMLIIAFFWIFKDSHRVRALRILKYGAIGSGFGITAGVVILFLKIDYFGSVYSSIFVAWFLVGGYFMVIPEVLRIFIKSKGSVPFNLALSGVDFKKGTDPFFARP